MAKEIERKFLVADTAKVIELQNGSEHIVQGYLNRDPERTVRVRIKGSIGFLTVKSKNQGNMRGEWEFEIPLADAEEMLRLCDGTVIEKVRHYVDYEGFRWEVDEFITPRHGLWVAEVELNSPADSPTLPSWLGEEVTGNPRFYNSSL